MSLLASLLATGDDIGDLSRQRAFQLLKECRWLDELLRAYDDADVGAAKSAPAERLRADVLAGEVLAALQLIHAAHVEFIPSEAWTCAQPVALQRALRNVLENAFRAAGPGGHVRVRVAAEIGAAVVQVDDDGPGFGAGPAGLGSLGLSIVRDALDSCGGWLEVSTSDLGGGRVRLHLPAPLQPSSVAVLESLQSLESPPAPSQAMPEPPSAAPASAAPSGSWNSEGGGARTGL